MASLPIASPPHNCTEAGSLMLGAVFPAAASRSRYGAPGTAYHPDNGGGAGCIQVKSRGDEWRYLRSYRRLAWAVQPAALARPGPQPQAAGEVRCAGGPVLGQGSRMQTVIQLVKVCPRAQDAKQGYMSDKGCSATGLGSCRIREQ